MEALQAQLQAVQVENNQLRERVKALEEALGRGESTAQQARAENADMQHIVQGTVGALVSAMGENHLLKTTITTLNEELEKVNKKCDNVTKELGEVKEELGVVHGKLSFLTMRAQREDALRVSGMIIQAFKVRTALFTLKPLYKLTPEDVQRAGKTTTKDMLSRKVSPPDVAASSEAFSRVADLLMKEELPSLGIPLDASLKNIVTHRHNFCHSPPTKKEIQDALAVLPDVIGANETAALIKVLNVAREVAKLDDDVDLFEGMQVEEHKDE